MSTPPGSENGSMLRRALLPDPPRDFAGRRTLKIVLRALHVLCVGILVGAHVFATTDDERLTWLLAAVFSGASILVLDLHESLAFLLQIRGVVLVVKILAVALLPWLGPARLPTLIGLVLLSVISSHAPAKVRYFLVFGRGAIRPARSRG
ncbi:MAG: hypothetical protein KDC98_23505 [Planctomycetes bacterium]|nr:hypothetical protein [Planctomycetota bacterium]